MVQKENIGRRGLANSLHYYVHIILIIYRGDTGLKGNAVTRGLKGDYYKYTNCAVDWHW